MRVGHSRPNVFVAQQVLHRTNVVTVGRQVRGERGTERVVQNERPKTVVAGERGRWVRGRCCAGRQAHGDVE